MKKGSVIFCTVFVCLFLALLVVLLFLAPQLVDAYDNFRALADGVGDVILIAFYLCAVPAAAALFLPRCCAFWGFSGPSGRKSPLQSAARC